MGVTIIKPSRKPPGWRPVNFVSKRDQGLSHGRWQPLVDFASKERILERDELDRLLDRWREHGRAVAGNSVEGVSVRRSENEPGERRGGERQR
jgi:hypothetical protein